MWGCLQPCSGKEIAHHFEGSCEVANLDLVGRGHHRYFLSVIECRGAANGVGERTSNRKVQTTGFYPSRSIRAQGESGMMLLVTKNPVSIL